MVLDDEMEQAAVKIQAAFRGKSSKKKETTTEGMKEFFLKKKFLRELNKCFTKLRSLGLTEVSLK